MKPFVFAVAAAVLVPIAAFAATSPSAARAQHDCAQLRTTMGATAFNQAYPTFGACVAAYSPVETQVQSSAQDTCTAQQNDPTFPASHDGKTFAQYYGTVPNGSNAFGNCVRGIASSNSQAARNGRLNPVRTCSAIRTTLGAALFNKTYGRSTHDTSAYGKCVASTAPAQAQNEVTAASSCRSQQADSTFAANHGGKTFEQYYGTNPDGSNAFGRCVAATARATSHAQNVAIVNAAFACQSELKADPAAFKSKYGTFGACVAQKAKR
ncbi:MAG: hypothetical protein QOG85_1641 [Gaiellaceae bacterium]|jgi:hypothetical protein|nr:hypothetical protein [Gaiellaceae bacterium]